MSEGLNVTPEIIEIREGTTKLSVDDILGIKADEPKTDAKEPEKKESEAEPEKCETAEEKTNKEIFAEVKALAYGFNFIVVGLSQLVANMMGKQIDTKNISATDAELARLAKVAQPVYVKHMVGMSDEKMLFLVIFSMYGFKIAGEFMNASDLAKKTAKETQKPLGNKKEQNEDEPFWKGNPDYFQTGKKEGQLKPSAK